VRLPVTAAEKVKFVDAELAATLNKLDDMIAGLTGPRTEVDDPDGLVRFTLSDDERLLSGLARNFGDVFVGAVMRRA
jgi:hypothetical protein